MIKFYIKIELLQSETFYIKIWNLHLKDLYISREKTDEREICQNGVRLALYVTNLGLFKISFSTFWYNMHMSLRTLSNRIDRLLHYQNCCISNLLNNIVFRFYSVFYLTLIIIITLTSHSNRKNNPNISLHSKY